MTYTSTDTLVNLSKLNNLLANSAFTLHAVDDYSGPDVHEPLQLQAVLISTLSCWHPLRSRLNSSGCIN
jgi:hypothetical protein